VRLLVIPCTLQGELVFGSAPRPLAGKAPQDIAGSHNPTPSQPAYVPVVAQGGFTHLLGMDVAAPPSPHEGVDKTTVQGPAASSKAHPQASAMPQPQFISHPYPIRRRRRSNRLPDAAKAADAPDKGDGPPFRFLSTFKWEGRKGWNILLEAYLAEFTSQASLKAATLYSFAARKSCCAATLQIADSMQPRSQETAAYACMNMLSLPTPINGVLV
jgi:hypothetical protein